MGGSQISRLLITSALACAWWPMQAHAQSNTNATSDQATEASDGLSDIIVTAQRRSESLQRVPIAVSVATNEALVSSGAIGVQSLKVAAPNVSVDNNAGFVLPFIRGIGSKASGASLEPPIAIYVDDVYYASTTSTLLGFGDIEQIEVLKGPQGTLFGRNATGGVIHVKTRDPKHDPGGEITLSYGNYDTLSAGAYVTGGLGDKIAASLTAQVKTMGRGYGHNLTTGADTYKIDHDIGLRGKVKIDLTDTTVIRLSADYTDHKGSDNVQRYPEGLAYPAGFGPAYGGGSWDTNANYAPMLKIEGYGGSLKIDQELGRVSLTSITAYRHTEFLSQVDLDYSQADQRRINIGQKDRQFSQEIQLKSDGGGDLDWVLGGYYFNARSLNAPVELITPLVTAGVRVVQVRTGLDTRSFAGFGQATWRATDKLALTAGLRYTSEKRGRDGTVDAFLVNGAVVSTPGDASATFNKLTWRLAADYRFTNRVMGYVSYNRGFKSGGWNSSALTLDAFRPEVLDAYEIGLKSDVTRQLRVNLSGFYYDYKDVQVQRYVGGLNGVANGAKAELYGGEVEVIAQLTPEWKVSGDYQYLHSEFKSFPNSLVAAYLPTGGVSLQEGDVSGNRTPVSPKHTFSVNSTYTVPVRDGSATASVNGYYNSGYFHEPDNLLRQPSYFLLNASVRWDIGQTGLAVSIWGNNLTNETVASSGAVFSYGNFGLPRFGYEPPRTYGATLHAKF